VELQELQEIIQDLMVLIHQSVVYLLQEEEVEQETLQQQDYQVVQGVAEVFIIHLPLKLVQVMLEIMIPQKEMLEEEVEQEDPLTLVEVVVEQEQLEQLEHLVEVEMVVMEVVHPLYLVVLTLVEVVGDFGQLVEHLIALQEQVDLVVEEMVLVFQLHNLEQLILVVVEEVVEQIIHHQMEQAEQAVQESSL